MAGDLGGVGVCSRRSGKEALKHPDDQLESVRRT
jgi:hypothetical protein